MEIPLTSRHDSGIYTCYADNGWIEEASDQVRVEIEFLEILRQLNTGRAESEPSSRNTRR